MKSFINISCGTSWFYRLFSAPRAVERRWNESIRLVFYVSTDPEKRPFAHISRLSKSLIHQGHLPERTSVLLNFCYSELFSTIFLIAARDIFRRGAIQWTSGAHPNACIPCPPPIPPALTRFFRKATPHSTANGPPSSDAS